MRVSVDFKDNSLELEIPDEHLVGAWNGPAGHNRSDSAEIIRAALKALRDFPPLRQAVVPGDHVTIAFDPTVPEADLVLAAVSSTLRDAGVEAEGLTVLLTRASSEELVKSVPPGTTLAVHDTDDASQLAYLATTKEGRRIYLNRHLTDADLVVPVGRVGFDPILGYSGPWSVLFPGFTGRESIQAHRSRMRSDDDAHLESSARSNREESLEVSWLLGTQYHFGVIPGVVGIGEVVAGREALVCEHSIAWLDEHWTFRPDSRAEIVVAGIGRSGEPTSLESLAQGLATARRLVQHGGKIVVLSQANGAVGPALRCLIDAGRAELGGKLLRGHENDVDFQIASRVAAAVSWADVFLFSGLDRDLVEELSIVPIEKPEQARRLVAQCRSALVVNQADWTFARVQEAEAP